MRVAIVVPFHGEPVDQLEQCIQSVFSQTYPCELVLVGDGPAPSLTNDPRFVDVYDVARQSSACRLIWLPKAHADFGNCARSIGALEAMGVGVDAVGFLDADNWLEPTHVAEMVALHEQSGAQLCTTSMWLARIDGTLMAQCADTDGENHADTSSIFVLRSAFHLLSLWSMIPVELAPIGDRVWFMLAKTAKVQRAHNKRPTVFYRTRYAPHYRAAGEEPPPGAKETPDLPPGEYHIELPALRLGLQIENTRPR